MTQNSNRHTYAPWGEPSTPATGGWASLVTVPALLGHIVLMLGVMAVLTILNLLVNPATWWSLAILVVWFTIVVIHALALVSIGVILEDDEEEPAPPPRVQAEPTIAPQALNGWHLPRQGPEPPPDVTAPEPWRAMPPSNGSLWAASARPADTVAPPETPPVAEQREQELDDDLDFTPLKIESDKGHDRIPWRAVTDIAWLRRRSRGNDGDADDSGRKASS